MSAQFVHIHADAYSEIHGKEFSGEERVLILAQLEQIEREHSLPLSREVFGARFEWTKLSVVELFGLCLYFAEFASSVELVLVARNGDAPAADEAALVRLQLARLQ